MEKLKPCPFCGSRPNFKVIKSDKKGKYEFGVGCSNIDCIIYLPPDAHLMTFSNYVWVYFKREDMVSAWNTRKEK